MAKFVGKLIEVSFAKETVRGTAVAASKWINKTNMTFDDKDLYVQDEGGIGSIRDAKYNYLVKKWGEWDIEMDCDVNALGFMLLSLLWAPTSAVATTWAYTHTYALVETNQTQSLTIGVKDPSAGQLNYANAVIDKITISVNAAQIAKVTATFKAKWSATTTHSVSYTQDYKLLARHAIFKQATNLAWLAWASAVSIRSFEITISKNVEEDMSLGTIAPDDFINKLFTVEWVFTLVFNDTTYKDFSLAGTQRAVRFELSDTTTTIWISSNPWLRIDLPLVGLTEFSKNMGSGEVVLQTLNFKAVRSYADASGISVVLTNTTASY